MNAKFLGSGALDREFLRRHGGGVKLDDVPLMVERCQHYGHCVLFYVVGDDQISARF